MEIRPQPGFQMKYLSSPADIVIGGGAAGAGKSFALLLENVRHVRNSKFGAVNFRRTMPQVRNEGGLWDTSTQIYLGLPKALRPRPLIHSAEWQFPAGSRVKFSHMQYEKDMHSWQGAQVPLIGFDELTHFLSAQFWYMLTRNRSTCGVKPYVRATTNPQSYGWVKDLIQWWIYPDNYPDDKLRGYPIPERDGRLRYMTRYKKRILWGDTPEDVITQLPLDQQDEWDKDSIKSMAFVGGTMVDNPELLLKDPSYKANLLAQDEETALQLLRGCWYSSGGDNELYSDAGLRDMFTNDFVPGGDRYMTGDIAMEGSDLFVIIIWNGWRAEHIYTVARSNGRQVLETMQMLAKKHAIPGSNIAFDSSGVGNFLKGWLKNAIDFRAGDPAIPDNKVKLMYKNLKTQCAYVFSRKVKECDVLVSVQNEDVQERIIEEFKAHKKKGLDKTNKLCMTDKDEVKSEIGYSPDYFDALTMRAVFELKKNNRKRSTKAM